MLTNEKEDDVTPAPQKRCKKCGRFKDTKWGKCEDCRRLENYDNLKLTISDLSHENRGYIREIEKLKTKLEGEEQSMGVQVKYSVFNCSEIYLKKLLKSIEPVSSVIQVNYGPNTDNDESKYKYSFSVKKMYFTMTVKRLQQVLECVTPVSECVFLEWKRL